MQDPYKNESLVDHCISVGKCQSHVWSVMATVNQSSKCSSTLLYCSEIHHKGINYIYCSVGLPYLPQHSSQAQVFLTNHHGVFSSRYLNPFVVDY